ncbi:MAG TPA: hypothetical protein VJZ94_00120, partial [Candidatus Paceibacterota bacterium]|nr:hypothetical protein [Candidatus Paceibacterota bacterium]
GTPAAATTKKDKKTESNAAPKGRKKKTTTLEAGPDDDVGDDYFSQFARGAQQWGRDTYDDVMYPPEPDSGEYADMKKLGEDANRINLYYLKFPQLRPSGKAHTWTGLDDPNEIEMELSRIRSLRNGAEAESSLKSYIVLGAKGLESITHQYGYNPLQLSVHQLGDAVATAMLCSKPGESPFDPEVTELAIEYGPWLGSGPEMRFLVKLAQFVYMYSDMQKNPEKYGMKLPGAPGTKGVHLNEEVPAAVVNGSSEYYPEEVLKTQLPKKNKKHARFQL